MGNRRPNAIRDRALELAAKGLSLREVEAKLAAEGLRASKSSVANWVRPTSPAPTSGAAGAPAATAATAATAASSSAPPVAPAGLGEWELPGVDLVHLPAALLEQLGRKFSARISEALAAKVPDFETVARLLQGHERVMKALVMARPPAKDDPEKDPANLEQAAIAVAHIQRMIAEARERKMKAVAAPLAA